MVPETVHVLLAFVCIHLSTYKVSLNRLMRATYNWNKLHILHFLFRIGCF